MLSSTIRDILLLAFVGSTIALPVGNSDAIKREPGKDAITFKYPIFKATEGANEGEIQKRGSDAIALKYPIFKSTEGASDGEVEKRGKDGITFSYSIFQATEGTAEGEGDVEKRDPKSPYADAIAAVDPRNTLG
ncbi:hypothetical protein CIB48_g10529 [Xylaria polymorpha]|nr:hypothetical protein CIB48_g10529 [Xylaria polymorpha]